MVTVLATVTTAAIRGITAATRRRTTAAIQGITAAMRQRITAAMPPPIMEGTALLMHRRITAAIDIVGSFARRSPTTAAPGITGGTVTIVTGELLGLR